MGITPHPEFAEHDFRKATRSEPTKSPVVTGGSSYVTTFPSVHPETTGSCSPPRSSTPT